MWTKLLMENKWITEISDLPKQQLPHVCPDCLVGALQWVPNYCHEELESWQAECTCGLAFEVFND